MVLEFFACSHAFDDGFFRMRYFRIKFNIQPLFHRPDDEKPYPPVKHNAIGCRADDNLGPIRYLRQYLIKNQYQLFGSPFE